MTRPRRCRSSGTWATDTARRSSAFVVRVEVERLALEPHRPAGRRADAGEHLEELGLAVAGDAGDADDLAGAHRQVDGLQPRDALRVDEVEVRAPRGPPGRALAGVFSTRSSTRRPTITSASSAGVVSAVTKRPHHLAAPHHADRVGHRHDLAELVGDEDDRLALGLQVLEDAEEVVGLGRASARRSARRGSGCRTRGRAPSGSRRAAAGRRRARRRPRRDRPRARIPPRAASALPAPWRATAGAARPTSAPRTTFSSTVKGSTSMKCWWTMPIPARIAARLSGIGVGRPSMRISPASAW